MPQPQPDSFPAQPHPQAEAISVPLLLMGVMPRTPWWFTAPRGLDPAQKRPWQSAKKSTLTSWVRRAKSVKLRLLLSAILLRTERCTQLIERRDWIEATSLTEEIVPNHCVQILPNPLKYSTSQSNTLFEMRFHGLTKYLRWNSLYFCETCHGLQRGHLRKPIGPWTLNVILLFFQNPIFTWFYPIVIWRIFHQINFPNKFMKNCYEIVRGLWRIFGIDRDILAFLSMFCLFRRYRVRNISLVFQALFCPVLPGLELAFPMQSSASNAAASCLSFTLFRANYFQNFFEN